MAAETERLRALLAKITELTTTGELRWERQAGSAHRYARWNNNLLILGPDASPVDAKTPRYLFITPFDSADCVEIGSNDEALGPGLLALVSAVEAKTAGQAPTDPFALSDDILDRLMG